MALPLASGPMALASKVQALALSVDAFGLGLKILAMTTSLISSMVWYSRV